MNNRPALKDRKFVSSAIEEKIEELVVAIKDRELAILFENCFPNTLDTTIQFDIENGKPDTFVITGDINAMWLRDSTAQVWPYLLLAHKDDKLQSMLAGVINRQTRCILLDSYANAFYREQVIGEWQNDLTEMMPGVHERKWEIDSLCYPIRLAYNFWKLTGDTSCYDESWRNATQSILKVLKDQQRKENNGKYRFGRKTHWSTDTVPGNGFGNPINLVGLIVSIFRPSDDATIFPYLIPSNFFAVVSLKQLAEMHQKLWNDEDFAYTCLTLASEVENAIASFSISEHLSFGKIYAYEVDGFGNKLFMDDANIPSLLSLPYLDCLKYEDPVYQNTRKFLFSNNNPYFFKGTAAAGIGSPHTLSNRIWPMSIIMRALTSANDDEIIECLHYLKSTHANTGFMHESFHKDNPDEFTRKWFGWANSLFAELIIKIYDEKPELLT